MADTARRTRGEVAAPVAPHSYYHAGVVVANLEAAQDELSRALGVRWGATRTSEYGEWTIRVAYSTTEPYIELIEGAEGSPWDPAGGPRLDHLGFFTEDVRSEIGRLQQAGLSVDFDPGPYGRDGLFAYLRASASGLRVEVVDRRARARLPGERDRLARLSRQPPSAASDVS